MGFAEIVSMIEGFDLPVVGALTPELALFLLSVVFFGFSTGLCALAVRAATGARDAQDDARVMMRTVQDYAVEMRQLAAQTEKFSQAAQNASGHEPEERLTDRIRSVRVGSRYDTDEARVDVEAEEAANDEQVDVEATDDANARLADAARAASEPRSLLSGMLRRR